MKPIVVFDSKEESFLEFKKKNLLFKGGRNMTGETQLLNKIYSLERLVQNKLQDEVIIQTLDRLIYYEEEKQRKELKELNKERKIFEKRYNMDSNVFHVKFHKGELGDETDFFEWDALCEMYENTLKKLAPEIATKTLKH